MAKNEEVKLEIDPEFAAFANVQPISDHNYCAADTQGVAEVVSITKRSGFKGLSLIFEFKAVESSPIPGTNGQPHTPGEIFAVVKKLDNPDKKKSGRILADAVSVLSAIMGLSSPAAATELPALLTKATSSAQPYRGFRIAYKSPRADDGRSWMKCIPMSAENTPDKVAARK